MFKGFLILQWMLLTAIKEITADVLKPPSLTGNPGEMDADKRIKYEHMLRSLRGQASSTFSESKRKVSTLSKGHGQFKHKLSSLPLKDGARDRKLQAGVWYPPPPPKVPKGGPYVVYPDQYPSKGYYPPGKGYYPPGKGGITPVPPPPNTDDLYPTFDDIPLIDDTYLDDAVLSGGKCRTLVFNETFFFMGPVAINAVGGSASAVGSQYIFSQNIYSPDGTVIDDSILSGVCTRTSISGIIGTSGAAVCQFNMVEIYGNYTVSAQGYLDTVATKTSAGKMVVTGGSGSMVSVVGEFNVIPVDSAGVFTTAELFTSVFAYFVQAELGVIVCPTLKLQ